MFRRAYTRVTDAFVPLEMRSDPAVRDVVRRARIVVAIALFSGGLVGAIFIAFVLSRGVESGNVWVTLASSIYYLLLPMMVRTRGGVRLAGTLLIAPVFVIFPLRSLGLGGISSSMATWYVLVPLIGTVLTSRPIAVALTLLTTLQVVGLTVWSLQHIGDANVGTEASLVVIKGVSLCILIAIVLATVSFFEAERQRSERVVAGQQAKLRAVAKMSGLREAATGVGNELRDPLARMDDAVNRIGGGLESDRTLREAAAEVQSAAKQIRRTIAGLLEAGPTDDDGGRPDRRPTLEEPFEL